MKEKRGVTLIELITMGVLFIIGFLLVLNIIARMMFNYTATRAMENGIKRLENRAAEDTRSTLEKSRTNEIENETEVVEKENEYRDDFVYENFWDNYGEEEKDAQTIESAIIQNEEYGDNQLLQLDITNEAVKNLYKLIRGAARSETESFHLSKKVTLEDFSFERIRQVVFSNITIDEVIESYSEGNRTYHDISAEVFENKAKELFGPELEIVHENFIGVADQEVIYEDGVYKKVHNIRNDFVDAMISDSYLSKAELDGDTVYLYDKYVYIEAIVDENDWPTGNHNIYSTDDKKTLIGDNIKIDYPTLWGGNAIWGDDKDQVTLDAMNDVYLDGQMLTFKHTFKKAEDGTYYWYSSEPIYE